MKYFLLIYSLLILPLALFASQADLSKSKGTTQDVIVQLIPSPAQEDVSRYTKIEATFNVPLDAKYVKKFDVKLKCPSCKKKNNIKGTVGYIEADNKVTFTPSESLTPGVYEIEFKSLKADKAHKKTKIKEIKYRFVVPALVSLNLETNTSSLNLGEKAQLNVMATYDNDVVKDVTDKVEWIINPADTVQIGGNLLTALKDTDVTVQAKMETIFSNTLDFVIYWEVNGHRLPPEPDKILNDSTLLGIDSNDNDVRDDVERYIYSRFMKESEYPKTKTVLAMQYARATQKVLENPVVESKKYLDDSIDCESYWLDTKTLHMSGFEYIKFGEKHGVFNDTALNDVMMNTKIRILQNFKFSEACSGHIFHGRKTNINNCQVNINLLEE